MTVVSRFVFFKKEKKTQQSSNRIRTSEISIVIPVKDNQSGIDTYLREFFNTHRPKIFPKEIIVVDNNSSVPIKIDGSFLSRGLPVKILRCDRPGPAAARNHGVSNSCGEWILFNDSDCVPTSWLLEGYLMADNASVAYAGNIRAFKKDRLSKYYESQEILLPLKITNDDGDHEPQYLITANTLVWKKTFQMIGGFNERMTIAGGEDIDLGLRLSQYGKLSYAFDSIALHDFNDGFVGFYKRFKRYGKGNRMVEEIWGTSLKPYPFSPNEKSLYNHFAALLQYLFLLGGYLQEDKRIKKEQIK